MAYDSASRDRVKIITKKQQEKALKRQRQKTTNTIRLFSSTDSYFEGIQKGKYYMIGTIHTEGEKEYGDMLYDDYQMRANEWYIIDVDNKHMDTKNNYEYNSIKTQLDACNAKVKSLSMGFTIKVVHKNDKKYKAEKQAKKLERERLKREKLEAAERLKRERLERKKLKRERLERERLEREKLERERLERKKLKRKRLERERLEREKLEAAERLKRLERERLEREKLEREKLEAAERERLKRELEREKSERERLEREKLERERLEAERLKRLERENQIRLERERQQRLEKERLERERERQAILKKEQEKKETEKQLQQMIETEINKQIKKKQLYRFTPICLKDTQKHNGTDEKNKDDDILYNKHRNILKQWNINSNKLKKFKWDINDDEKKENDKSESGVELYNKYTNCIPVINEQTNRLTQVTTDDYLLQLINRQNSLSKSVKQDEQKSQSNFSDYNGKKERYETVKQQRIELQREIDTLFKKCNETIQCENTLYKQLKECTIKKEAIDKNIENMKSSSKLCVAVIKSYNDFMENNKKYIDRINTDFKEKWNEFEANWREWNIPDIIVWFKYCTIEMNTQKINWMSVENQLKNRNITGKSLENFNNLVFELIGIHDFNIVTHLGSQIAIILKKYPVNNDKNNQNVIKTAGKQKIPEEYICSITKTIMQDPVMAFDGYTYERSAIESYLKINNKSPVTGDDAEYVVVFPNHKLRAVIQKYIKENNIDVEQEKEGCREGIVETSYL